MQPDPMTVSPRAPIREAIERMCNDGVECLPVVEDGQLVGIVSEHDQMVLVEHRCNTFGRAPRMEHIDDRH